MKGSSCSCRLLGVLTREIKSCLHPKVWRASGASAASAADHIASQLDSRCLPWALHGARCRVWGFTGLSGLIRLFLERVSSF